MIRKSLTHLGLCLVVALLCCALFGISAMAEDIGFNVTCPDLVVPAGENAIIGYYIDPSTLPEGVNEEDLTIACVVKDVSADDAVVYDEDVPDDLGEDGQGFEIPARRLKDGHAYRVDVTVTPEGEEALASGGGWFSYGNSETEETEVALWLNDGEPEATVRVHEDVMVNIYAPGATAILMGNGNNLDDVREWDEWEDWFQDTEEPLALVYGWSDPGEYPLYARICMSDPDDPKAKWYTTQVAHVTVTADDEFGAPSVTFDATVPRGEMLEYTVANKPDGAERLIVWAFDEDDRGYYRDEIRDEGTYTIPTADMAPGNYKLHVWWYAVGIKPTKVDLPFTVTEPLDPVVFGVDRDQVTTHQSYALYGYVQGASGLCVFEGSEIRETFEGRNSFLWYDGAGEEGERTYTLGQWDDQARKWVKLDKDVKVTVTAEGDMPLIELSTVDYSYFESDTVETSAYSDSGDLPDGTWFHWELHRTEDWEQLRDGDVTPGDPMIRIECGDLGVDTSYTLQVWANCRGYNSSLVEAPFFVMPIGRENDISLWLDADTCQVNEDVGVHISAPGATGVELFWEGHWERLSRRGNTGEYHITMRPGGPRDHILVARACDEDIEDWQWDDWRYDDFNWSYYSAAQVLHVTDEGEEAGLPTITLNEDEYDRGETVNVTLSDLSENAQEYHVRIIARNERGDFEDEAFFAAVRDIGREGSIEVKLPTARLIEGDYMVGVAAIGMPGWRNADTDRNDQSLIFHVNEPDAGSIMFKGNSPVWTHDTIAVSAYVPGAERLCVFENGENRGEFDGDSFVFFDGDGNPGTRVYRLGIWNAANDAWDQPNDVAPVIVEIMAKEGSKLDDPQISPPIQMAYGGQLTFRFEPVEGADWYYVSVRDESDDWRTVFELDCNHQNDDEAVYEFTVPSSRIQEGHSYVISVDANARGCASGHSEARAVAVSSDAGQSIALTAYAITGGVDGEEYPAVLDLDANTQFGLHVTVHADGVEIDHYSYQLFYDDEWHELDPYDDMDIDDPEDVQDGDFRFRWGSGNSGIKTALIRAQYHDDDADEWRWAYSNSVQMNISPKGSAVLPEAHLVDGENCVVTQGDLLRVALTHGEDDADTTSAYHLRIYPCQGDRWEEKVFREAGLDEAVVGLPTGALAPGRYRVQTIAIGRPGYDNAWVDEEEDLYFTVTERQAEGIRFWAAYVNEDGEVVTSEATDGNTQELNVSTGVPFTVTAFIPDVEDGQRVYYYCRNYDKPTPVEGQYATEEWTTYRVNDLVFNLYLYDEETDETRTLPQRVVIHARGNGFEYPLTIEHVPVRDLEESDPLVFRFDPVDEDPAIQYETWVRCDEEWIEGPVFRNDAPNAENDQGEPCFEFVYDGELKADTVYAFEVTAYGKGYAPAVARAETVVLDSSDDDPVIGLRLRLGGGDPDDPWETEHLEVSQMSEDIDATVSVPKQGNDAPAAVQVLWADEWDSRWRDAEPEDEESEGDTCDYIYHGRLNVGSTYVIARATYDEPPTDDEEEWEGRWFYSNAVQLTAESVDVETVSVPGVEVAYDADSRTVQLTLTDLPDPDTYNGFDVSIGHENEDWEPEEIEVCDADGENPDTHHFFEADTFTGDTGSIVLTLPEEIEDGEYDGALPGEYYVNLYVDPKPGYTGSDVSGYAEDNGLWFTVPIQYGLVFEDSEGEEHVVDHLDDVPVYSEVTLRALLGGGIYNIYRNSWDDHVDEQPGPGLNDVTVRVDGPGTYTFFLVREADHGAERIASVTVTAVGDPMQQLKKPLIEAEPVFDLTDEDFLTNGYPITVYYDEPAGKRFNIEVFDEDATNEAIENGEDWPEPIFYAEMEGSDFDEDGAYECAIPANEEDDEQPRFKANGRYILFVNVEADGMLGNHGALNFVESHIVPEQLVLTIAGQTDGTVETQASKDLSISIDVNGVSEEDFDAGKVELFWNNEWHSMENEEVTWNDDGCRFEFRWSTQGHSVAVARILDENDENDIYSNPVAVNAAIEGSVKPVAVTLDKRRVRRGQPLEVSIEAQDDAWAKEYHVRIYGYGYDEDGYDGDEEVEYYMGVYAPGTQTIELPTSQLPVGEENNYRVDVYVRPVEGATDWSTSGEDPDLRFTVLEGRQIAFDIDRATVPTQTDAFITAFVPGAEEIQILVDGEVMYDDEEEWGHAWGESCQAHYGSDHASDHTFTLRYRIEGEDEFRTYGTELALRVNAEGGDLDEPGIDIGTVVDPDDPDSSSFSVTLDAHAEYADIRIRDRESDEEIWRFNGDIDGNLLDFPLSGVIDDGRCYRIEVYSCGTGYNYATREKDFLAMKAPEPDEPHYVVMVNGSTAPVTVQANEPFLISFELKGQTEDEVYYTAALQWFGEWTSDPIDSDGRQGLFSMSTDEDQVIAIRGEYDDPDSDGPVYIFSNAIPVTVLPGGRVQAPEPVLSADRLGRDETLTVTFAGDPNVANYHFEIEACVYNDEGEDWEQRVSIDAPTKEEMMFSVPAALLSPNEAYRVRVFAEGKPGYANNESDRDDEHLRFRVDDAEIEELRFEVDKTEVSTQERFTFTAVCPGEETELALFHNNEWEDVAYGNGFVIDWQEGEPGTYTYALGAYDERIRGYRRLSETETTVTVTAEHDLDKAEIVARTPISAGEDLVFSFDAVPNAEWYDVEVIDTGDFERLLDRHFDAVKGIDAYRFTVDANMIVPESVNEVRVHAHARGYADSHAEKRIVAIPEPDPNDVCSIAVSVEPEPEPDQKMPVHTQLEFTAVSTGFEPEALQIFWDDEWQDIERRDITGDLKNATVVKDMYRSGSIEVLFRAWYYDDEGEIIRVYSDPVTLEIAKGQPITGFDAHLEAQTSTQGDLLQLTLSSADEGIDHFDVQVHAMNEWGDYYEHRYSLYVPGFADEAGVTVGLPTLELEPGATYRVQVNACGKLGYEDSTLPYDREDLYFEVTEQPEAEPMFTVSKTELTAGENYTLSARAPGAWKLVFYRDGEEWFNWGDGPDENPEQMTSCEGFDQAGTYTLELIALNKRGDEMDYAFEPIEITVKSKGALAEVDASEWPLTLTVGDAYTFTVKPVAGATRYDIHVIDEDSNFDPQDDLLHWNGAITDPDGKTFTVDASKFAGYEAGQWFRVGVYAGADGYDASWVESRFALVDPTQPSLNLSVESETPVGGIYALTVNKDYTVCAAPEGIVGITAVQISWDDGWRDLEYDDQDGIWTIGLSSLTADRVLLARYTTDPIDEQTEDEDLDWTLAGDSLQLRFKSEGQVAPVEYTLNTRDGKLLSTQDLTVSFEHDGEHVDHFAIFIRLSKETNGIGTDRDILMAAIDPSDGVDGAFSCTIKAEDIMAALTDLGLDPIGTELRVSADAIGVEGYDDNYSDYREEPRFTIMESLGKPEFHVDVRKAWIAGKPMKLELPEVVGIESYNVEISWDDDSQSTTFKNKVPGDFTTPSTFELIGGNQYTCTVTANPAWGYDQPDAQNFEMTVISADDANGKKLVLPAMLTEIDDEAFMNNDALIVVVLPQGIQSIGTDAFANCDDLAFVILPDNASMDTLFAVGIPNVFEGSDGVSLITRAEAAELGITLN